MDNDYEVVVSEEARKILEKFDMEIRRRFVNKIEKLKLFPDIYGKPLKYDLAGSWELYFEKRWRIIFKINKAEKMVEIVTIWHKDEF